MKSKTLRKKIRRLETRIDKDTRKLARFKRRQAEAGAGGPKKTKKRAKKTSAPRSTSSRAQKPKKKKRSMSPEARAKLAALMKERWAARRAASAEAAGPDHAAASDSADAQTPS